MKEEIQKIFRQKVIEKTVVVDNVDLRNIPTGGMVTKDRMNNMMLLVARRMIFRLFVSRSWKRGLYTN
jgi:hypothetical protein